MLHKANTWFWRFVLITSIFISAGYAQQPGQNENDIITQAQALFEKENYKEALPLFAQLVSVHPENPEYNYKFGVCTFHGDRTDRRRPIRYLTNALRSMGNDPQLHYYLGMAYYQNEEFAEAMKFLNLYLAKLDAGSPERPEILERVNACLNGLNLEHSNRIDEIIVKAEFQKENFHRAYRADDFNGMLIIKPDALVSPKEKNSGINSFVFISEPRGTVYYSGFETSGSTQRDLFKVKMLDDGGWGTPEKISDVVNTNFDEAYPVMTDYGTTLYFCSKGHNSMGGYDVFRSKLDTASGEFSQPENLGIGINSPFNDILFIPGKSGQQAYFATDRDNLGNGINVYKVRLIDHAFGEEVMLADNGANDPANVKETQVQENAETEKQEKAEEVVAQNNEPQLAPSEKAATLMNKRTMVHKLADTAYLMVAETKNLIRNLTNKRDRANAISDSKAEQAKKMEVEFEAKINSLAEITSDEEFDAELKKVIALKKDIFQYRKRADHANLIAWQYGKQIKIKNEELEVLKKQAGEVQTLSLSGDFDNTLLAYNELMAGYREADSLSDYSPGMLTVNSDEMHFDVPLTELAFADELKTGYQNNTLVARNSAPKPRVTEQYLLSETIVKETAVKTIEPAKQVEEIVVNLAVTFQIEEELEIGFSVDAIDPVKLVEPVLFSQPELIAGIEDAEIVVDFSVDAVVPLKLVEPVTFAANVDFSVDDEIEINLASEAILVDQVEQIAFSDPFPEIADGEELEIGFDIDAAEVIPLVEMIAFKEKTISYEAADEELSIRFGVDAVTPIAVVDQIHFEIPEIGIDPEDIDLVINIENDVPEPVAVVQPVYFEEEDLFAELNEELEIGVSTGALYPVKLVEPVSFTAVADIQVQDEIEVEIPAITYVVDPVEQIEFSYTIQEINTGEELEISIDQTGEPVVLIQTVQAIVFNADNPLLMEDEDLEISDDMAEAVDLVQVIAYQPGTTGFVQEIEDIEIIIEPEVTEITEIEIAKVVQIPSNLLTADIELAEESLEISHDPVQPLPLVSPVKVDFLADVVTIGEEELEIGLRDERIRATSLIRLTEPVYQENLTSVFPEIDEVLEISNDKDYVEPVALAEVITFNPTLNTTITIEEEELYISERIDELYTATLPAEEFAISQMPAIGTELFYLRESLSIATDIETSRTDYEMLQLALSKPGDLSYEELLFSASLANNADEKMQIFNQAFIHIDRDWRAFNNAAVNAMNSKDFETAECFLYQASLLSEDNGKISNNMGILACYMNDFDKAEKLFAQATKFGVDAEYNLSVARNMNHSDKTSPDQLREQIGEHHYYEVLGEAIDPGAAE